MENYRNVIYHKTMAVICIICMALGLSACASRTQPPPANKPAPISTPAPTAMPTAAPTPSPTAAPTPVVESLLDFYPLKPGNMWEYEGEGMEYASNIQKVVYSSGNKHQVTMDTGGAVVANVIQVKKDSIVNTYRAGEPYNGENILNMKDNLNIILLQTPLEKGNFWISEENHYEIVDTEADVEVPAGRFKDCIAVRVTFKDQTSNMVFYYKKGIGLVQSEFRTDEGDLITSKLKRYEFK